MRMYAVGEDGGECVCGEWIPPRRANGMANVALKFAADAPTMVCLQCAANFGLVVYDQLRGEVFGYVPEPRPTWSEHVQRWLAAVGRKI